MGNRMCRIFSEDDCFREKQQIGQNPGARSATGNKEQKKLLLHIIDDMDCITERCVEKSDTCGFRNFARIRLGH